VRSRLFDPVFPLLFFSFSTLVRRNETLTRPRQRLAGHPFPPPPHLLFLIEEKKILQHHSFLFFFLSGERMEGSLSGMCGCYQNIPSFHPLFFFLFFFRKGRGKAHQDSDPRPACFRVFFFFFFLSLRARHRCSIPFPLFFFSCSSAAGERNGVTAGRAPSSYFPSLFPFFLVNQRSQRELEQIGGTAARFPISFPFFFLS